VTNESQLDAVTEAVAAQHSKLLGFPQPVAECWYIVEAQHLDGYGQERFLAKVVKTVNGDLNARFINFQFVLSGRTSWRGSGSHVVARNFGDA
jgi:hypothetical protein